MLVQLIVSLSRNRHTILTIKQVKCFYSVTTSFAPFEKKKKKQRQLKQGQRVTEFLK